MIRNALSLPPLAMSDAARANMTAGCRDCDDIPKAPDAGAVIDDNGRDIQIMHNGVRVVAGGYYGDWMTDIIRRLKGHHEPQEERIFHEVLKFIPNDAVMLELGAFWCYYSLWFLHGHERRRTFVVEPDPNHLAIGRQNAALNNKTMVFVQASVGATPAPPAPFPTDTAGMVDIPRIAVPEFMAEHGIETLDLLHCDTQGAEIAVVESCMALFRARRIQFGFFSTHSHHISGDPLTHQRCLELIIKAGGQILAEHDVQEGVSGDGLIAAYFGSQPLDWTEPKLTLNRYSTSFFRNPLYDLAAVSLALDESNQRNDELDAQSRSCAEQLDAMTDSHKALQKNLGETVQALDESNQRNNGLDTQLRSCAEQLDGMTESHKALQKNLGETLQALDESNQRNDELDVQLRNCAEQLDAMTESHKALQKNLGETLQALDESNQRNNELDAQLRSCAEQLDATTESHEDVQKMANLSLELFSDDRMAARHLLRLIAEKLAERTTALTGRMAAVEQRVEALSRSQMPGVGDEQVS